MIKLSRKERRRETAKLHLLDEHFIAIGHVAVRAGMLDKMIEMTAEQVLLQYPKTVRKEGLRLPTPKNYRSLRMP